MKVLKEYPKIAAKALQPYFDDATVKTIIEHRQNSADRTKLSTLEVAI
jgi:hypothetical protein